MIFKPEMVELILSGRKTVTRRPVKLVPNLQAGGWDGQRDGMIPLPCKYRAGKDYAIQPGRGKKAIGRLRVVTIDCQDNLWVFGPSPFDVEEARREGFQHAGEFVRYWRHLYNDFDATRLVHRIEFELITEAHQ